MAGSNTERVTRSGGSDKDEIFIQKIIEKVLVSPLFLEKLTTSLAEKLAMQDANIKVYTEKVDSLESKCHDLSNKVESLEQYSRKNNLRIFGVPKTEGEDTESTVIKLIKDKLNISILPNDIDCCHRLKEKEGQHPPIIVKFWRRVLRNKIFFAKSKLKGSKIVIREDLTQQRAYMVKQLLKRTGRNTVYTVNGNIFVKFSGKINKISSIDDYSKFMQNMSKTQ